MNIFGYFFVFPHPAPFAHCLHPLRHITCIASPANLLISISHSYPCHVCTCTCTPFAVAGPFGPSRRGERLATATHLNYTPCTLYGRAAPLFRTRCTRASMALYILCNSIPAGWIIFARWMLMFPLCCALLYQERTKEPKKKKNTDEGGIFELWKMREGCVVSVTF